ncbi:MAG: hypothetical protein Q9214_006575 [Letrouitia sp. 1 TL-2023]
MDEFAQTRQPDDLFDDDFTPISEPVVQPVEPRQTHLRGGYGDRARGRGRGRIDPTPGSSHHAAPTTSQQGNAAPMITSNTDTDSTVRPSVTAVRGDRSATGGNAKPKLTEEELSARLEAAKLNSARREEAHRLAEADEASFQQREAQATQKRQEENRARRLMDQEREKNRLRKLGAQGGREWDEGKENQESPRGSQYRRGAQGGVGSWGVGYRENDPGLMQDEDANARGRGFRGGRARSGRNRGGRGRGRGFENDPSAFGILKPPPPNAETDFPALPTLKSVQPEVEIPAFEAPEGGKQSWADEVEVHQPATRW